MLAERVPAEQALAWGLVNRVVATTADSPIALVAPRRRTDALLRGTKRSSTRGRTADGRAARTRGAIQQEMAGSQDFLEGVTPSCEKRPATFGDAECARRGHGAVLDSAAAMA